MSAWRHPNYRDPATLPVELRRPTVPPAARAWVEREAGAAVVRVRRLAGASTSAVHRVDLANGARLVLRRYVWPAHIEEEPDAPRREVDAMSFAAAHGLAAPRVVAADLAGALAGEGVPAVLMTLVPGRARAELDVWKLAQVAAAIHSVDPDGFEHEYYPWWSDTVDRPPPRSRRPQLWERAIELRTVAMPPYRPVFVHRDFHPGNVLWHGPRPTGVVDWVDACRGPAGCDLAQCRDNVIRLGGMAAADAFLGAYQSLTAEVYHPYWELAQVLEHSRSHWSRHDIAPAEHRLAAALAALT